MSHLCLSHKLGLVVFPPTIKEKGGELMTQTFLASALECGPLASVSPTFTLHKKIKKTSGRTDKTDKKNKYK